MIESTAAYINNQYSDDRNSASIMQGIEFRIDKKDEVFDGLSNIITQFDKYINSVRETLGSVESLESMEDTVENSKDAENITALMDQYNTLLSEFAAEQKQFYQNALSNSIPDTLSKFLETRYKTTDNRLIYINKYGYTHTYSSEPTEAENTKCPTITSNIVSNTELSSLRGESYNFTPNMQCGLAGNIITNTNGELAWVDIKGYKHIFAETTLKDASGCDATPISVDDATWDSIPNASAMKSADNCTTLKLDNSVWEQLTLKNSNLIALADKILNILNTKGVVDTSTDVHQHKQTISTHKQLLKSSSTNIDYILNNQETIDGKQQVSEIAMKSALNKYIVWMIVAITIFLITMHSIYFNSSNLAYIVVLVMLLIILYRYSGYVYDRL